MSDSSSLLFFIEDTVEVGSADGKQRLGDTASDPFTLRKRLRDLARWLELNEDRLEGSALVCRDLDFELEQTRFLGSSSLRASIRSRDKGTKPTPLAASGHDHLRVKGAR